MKQLTLSVEAAEELRDLICDGGDFLNSSAYLALTDQIDAIRSKKPRLETTPSDLITKCPDMERESLAGTGLEDMACPECGSRYDIGVTVTTGVTLCCDGTDDDKMNGDHVYDDDSPASCRVCGFDGVVSDFHIVGLDDLLEELNNEDKENQNPDDANA